MKKILAAIVSTLAIAALCICFAACSTNVAGKTFEFSDVEVTYSGEIPEGQEATVNASIEAAKAFTKSMYAGATVTFNTDGTCTMKAASEEDTGYYKQVNNKVYMLNSADDEVNEDDMHFVVEGNKLILETEEQSLSMKVIFVKK